MNKPKSIKAMAADKTLPVKKDDLYKIDPRIIDEEEGFNLRSYDDPEVIAHIEGFADSYMKGRYVPPLILRVTDDGRVVPVEGHCRRRGALLAIERGAALEFIHAVPFKGNDVERVELMLRSAEGLRLKPLSVAFGYLRLHRYGHSNAQIADAMRKTPARVEQMLLLATANHDVHQLVESDRVTADVAIEAIRQYGEKAGDFLQGKLVEAIQCGKTKVTRSAVRGVSFPPKVVSAVVESVDAVVSRLDASARRALAELEGLDADSLSGKTVQVDAAALLDLLRAQGSIQEVKAKREASDARARAAAAQDVLDVNVPVAHDANDAPVAQEG